MADLLRQRVVERIGKRKRRGKGRDVGPPVHADIVKRDFTAARPNRWWLADITEHRTGEGKLHLCAIKDVWSNQIVGYSIDARMKSRLAVAALDNAAARQQLWIAIVTWIERTYRRRRQQQQSLTRLTPIEFETIMTRPASQAA